MTAPAVVGLGEVMLRLSPVPGRRLENADSLNVHTGGAEANVLAGLARLGVPTALVSALPDSSLGRRAAAELAAAGVDLGLLQWLPNARMGTFFVEQGFGARATTVLYDRSGSAFAEGIGWPPGALAGAAYALVSGITPALGAPARAAVGAMIDEAERGGVPLCLDVNYRARLWSPEAARETLAPLLGRAEVAVCGAHDAEHVFRADPDDPAAFRARWAPRAGICVITHGEFGCRAVGKGDELIATEAIGTEIVDRPGLGDAFLAGLLHTLLGGGDLEAALRAGVALAALKATVAGDISLARREDLTALLESSITTRVLR
jgi:2-dehydro-3-deoxygluconokinase